MDCPSTHVGIFYDRNETSGAERLYVGSSQGVQAFEMNGTLIQTLDSSGEITKIHATDVTRGC